ncbi:N-acetylgalactosamine-6-sulfatase [Flavobacterium rhamnosiphilum]|uniref:N-acetylgalactosamine-6-sulfatase n=1 Tax=Flavobacterium rhamnosiphilum TaxID=2541724 RepID=A0A4R5F909_9FLAO|nr:arylsulfatase [Flavobacterium rhamnosiphilum]TDE44359.1 N-acetylgalactosamine-6-sulfatase [Flavobacterium rhamnosiphilum]
MNKIWNILIACLITSIVFAQQKPNIIYIYADDLGYGELGSYGQQKIKTPNLDKIAKEGIKFTQHYTGAPVCAPARCMLMTGKNSGHSYIRGNYELGGFEDENEGGQMPLPEGTFTIAKLMQQAGYITGAIGKWGLGMNTTTGNPNKQGFDYFYGYLCQKQAHNFYPTHLWENGKWDTLKNPYIQVHKPLAAAAPDTAFDYFKGKEYSVTKMAEKTLDFIKKNKKKPFFLYLPYTGPHVSLQAPDEAVKEYIGKFEEQPYHGEKGYASTLYPKSTYAAMITYMDEQVGRIMKLLKELGLDENTIVMFSSDNGATFDVGGADTKFFNSVGGLRGRKQDLYEGGIREPFIARWPGKIPAGKVSNHISAQFDMMATLSEITGVKAWDNDGISLLPTLMGNDNKQKNHDYLYFEFPEKGGQVAVRMGDWKGVKSNMKKNKNASWEIYNLKTDEKETTDIAAQHPELAKKFEEILKKEHQSSHIKDWEFIDPKFSER